MKGKSKAIVRGGVKGSIRGRNGKRRRAKEKENENEGGCAATDQSENPHVPASASGGTSITPSPKKKKGSVLAKYSPAKLFRDLDRPFLESAAQLRKDVKVIMAAVNDAGAPPEGEVAGKDAGAGGGMALEQAAGGDGAPGATGAKKKERKGWADDTMDDDKSGDQPMSALDRLSWVQSKMDAGSSLQDRDILSCLLSSLAMLAAKEDRVDKLCGVVEGLRSEVAELRGEVADLKRELGTVRGQVNNFKLEHEKVEVQASLKELIAKRIPDDLPIDQLKKIIQKDTGISPSDLPEMTRLGLSAEARERLRSRGVVPSRVVRCTFPDVATKYRFLSSLKHLKENRKEFRFDMSFPKSKMEDARRLQRDCFEIRKKYGYKTQLRYSDSLELQIMIKKANQSKYTLFDCAANPI